MKFLIRRLFLLLPLLLTPSSLWAGEVAAPAIRRLSWPDYVAILAYFALVVWIGFRSSRQKTTADYFLGGRKIPWWAAGISLYATGTSAISFMAIPAKTFHTDWKYYQASFFSLAGLFLIGHYIIPLVRRLNLVSIYEYLEQRFSRAVRLMGSTIYILLQLGGRISIVLFLPSLAVATVTGLNVHLSILLLGVVTILYTTKGGFTAVIWTDIAQVIVLFGGAVLALVMIIINVHLSPGQAWTILQSHHKLDVLDTRFDVLTPTIWLFFLQELAVMLTWVRDQTMLQRVLATPDVRNAVRSIWTLNLLTIPGGLIFFSMGSALYLFYQTHPAALDPALPHDAIFPFFIAQELPAGLVGLVIAGLFAGSMATLSSSINSVTTAIVTDFGPWLPGSGADSHRLREAKIISVIVGAIGTGLALVMSTLGAKSMWDIFIAMTGLIGGGFGGIFALGLFTRRTNWQGAIIGTIMGTALALGLACVCKANAFLYGIVATFGCIGIGYVASYFFPPPPQSLGGLTIYESK